MGFVAGLAGQSLTGKPFCTGTCCKLNNTKKEESHFLDLLGKSLKLAHRPMIGPELVQMKRAQREPWELVAELTTSAPLWLQL